jgi:glutathione S-transferase
MIIHGHPLSSCTRKVLVMLAEKGQRADLVEVDLFRGDQRAPDHVARHPFGLVPVLEDDDGFVLYESRAILRYIDARYPDPPLAPAGSRESARMNQWLSVDQSYVAPHLRTLAIERIIKKHDGQQPDRAAEDHAERGLARAFAVVDRALADSEYLAGERFSLADISLMPYVGSLPMLNSDHLLADRPRLGAWWAKVQTRESWRRANDMGTVSRRASER